MKVPATIRWVALALLGLLIAAGVSIAASSLASQQIGLASEPISAGDALAPQASSRTNGNESHRHKASPAKIHRASPAKTPTEPAPTKTIASPPASTEPHPPAAAPPSTVPVVPSGSSPSGGEQDHSGGGSGHPDD